MSLEGWLMHGDRGPIIGRWPVAKVEAPQWLHAGDRIVIDNGMIRPAKANEVGVFLPKDSEIVGSRLAVPEWWWRLHFGEILRNTYPAEACCFDGALEFEQCGDCPR